MAENTVDACADSTETCSDGTKKQSIPGGEGSSQLNNNSSECNQITENTSSEQITRLQVTSFIKQLEEKHYVKCPHENCRFIALSLIDVHEHILECSIPENCEELKLCKYCPHGAKSQDVLTNHVIFSHPDASEVVEKRVELSFEDSITKKKKLANPQALEFLKFSMRVSLQDRGFITCPTPTCRYVSSLIPKMKDHYLHCSPAVWKKLKFDCDKCSGRTFTRKQLTNHVAESHPFNNSNQYHSDKIADESVIAFWELSIQEFGASKCASKKCFYVSPLISRLKEHYRYCWVPQKQNYDVCHKCHGWFESLKELDSHKTTFHSSSSASSKIAALVNLDVASRIPKLQASEEPGSSSLVAAAEPRRSNRLPAKKNHLEHEDPTEATQKKRRLKKPMKRPKGPFSAPKSTDSSSKNGKHLTGKKGLANDPIELDDADMIHNLMNQNQSHLEEIGKSIKQECKEETPISVQITVGDRSWNVDVPSIDKASEVIDRKMPSVSVKKIVSESLEDSLSLLRLSFFSTKIECNSNKPYFPPKPLDFALEKYYSREFHPSTPGDSTNVHSTSKASQDKTLTINQSLKEKSPAGHTSTKKKTVGGEGSNPGKGVNAKPIDRPMVNVSPCQKTYKPLGKSIVNGGNLKSVTSTHLKVDDSSNTTEKPSKKVNVLSSELTKSPESLLQQQSILDAIERFGVDPNKISEIRFEKPNHIQVFTIKDANPSPEKGVPHAMYQVTRSVNNSAAAHPKPNRLTPSSTNAMSSKVISSASGEVEGITALENTVVEPVVECTPNLSSKAMRSYSRIKPCHNRKMESANFQRAPAEESQDLTNIRNSINEASTSKLSAESLLNLPTSTKPDCLEKTDEHGFFHDSPDVPFEVIWESVVALKGGLYNGQFPWEGGSSPHSKCRKFNNVPAVNPYRSSKLREKLVCNVCQREKLSEGTAAILCEAKYCECTSKKQSLPPMNGVQELTKYLTKVKPVNFVNEPLVYVVDKIIPDKRRNNKNSEQKGKANSAQENQTSGQITLVPSDSTEVHDDAHLQKVSDEMISKGTSSPDNNSLPTPIEVETGNPETAPSKKRKRNPSPSSVKKPEFKKKRQSKKSNGSLMIAQDGKESKSSKRRESNKEEDTSLPGPSTPPSGSSCAETLSPATRNSPRQEEVPTTSQNNSNEQKGVDVNEPRKSRRSKSYPRKLDISSSEPKSVAPVKTESDDDTAKPKRKRTRKSQRIADEASESGNENANRFLYLDNDDQLETVTPVTADERITYSSAITDPHKLVVCAVCGDNMSTLVYKNTHMATHNYLCWLVGEEPLNLEDEKFIDRYLFKIYISAKPKPVFKCEVCGVLKKSPQGFLSHRRLCGKSVKERSEVLVSCKVCSRMLLPVSLPFHMARNHAEKKKTNEAETESPLGRRKASSRASVTISEAVNEICDETEYIDENEEMKAVENDEWIRMAYSYCKRRLSKHIKSVMEEAVEKSGEFKCIIVDCTFSNSNLNTVLEHYKVCDKLPLDWKCNECNFLNANEARIINHVRMSHSDKAHIYAKKNVKLGAVTDTSDIGGIFIPYIKSAELNSRSQMYLQPALQWTDNLQKDFMFFGDIFPSWKVDSSAKFKTLDQISKHVDLREESMRIAFTEKKPEWCTLKKLSVRPISDDAAVMYTGGTVRTLDWFPSPSEQYMAISIGSKDSDVSIKSVHSGPGHFQIWSAGSLNNFDVNYPVQLKFELAVCHNYGEVWDLQCCPGGVVDENRLGLVAIATSSGKVAIYAIPVMDSWTTERAFEPEPSLVLDLGLSDAHQVTKLSWSRHKPHRLLAAGYSNGMVGIWDLTSNSTLLKSQNCLLPFKVLPAHLTVITGLSFSPVNEYYLATACSDKSSKQWNLHDTSAPQAEFTKGLVTDLTWMPHWMSTITTLDDNFMIGSTTVSYNPLRNFMFQSQPLITLVESTPMSVSVNDWVNCIVCGYDNGQVALQFVRKQISGVHDDRKRIINCLINPEWHDFNPKAKEPADIKSYSETCKRFGVILNHNFHILHQFKFKSQPCGDMAQFPSLPANKVIWNPNRNSFLTLATGFQSGLVILNRIKFPKNEQTDLMLIMDNLNEETVRETSSS